MTFTGHQEPRMTTETDCVCVRCGKREHDKRPVVRVKDERGEWVFVHIDCIDPEVDRQEPTRRPQRIQRRRSKGWRMPEGAVYVGRPTRFGNPYHAVCFGGRAQAVEQFRIYANWPDNEGAMLLRASAKAQLRGKDLACWCPLDEPCHADVLLEIANEEPK